jgi:hypothetical protein
LADAFAFHVMAGPCPSVAAPVLVRMTGTGSVMTKSARDEPGYGR